MPARVSPIDAIRAEIHELFGCRDITEVLEEVMSTASASIDGSGRTTSADRSRMHANTRSEA